MTNPKSAEELLSGKCVLWHGGGNGHGYGRITSGPERGRLAHRVLWEKAHGPVPAGLQLDHICRVKLCVNLQHLRTVTSKENNLREAANPTTINAGKVKCLRGHVLSGRNLYIRKEGYRQCMTCHDERQSRRRDKDLKNKWAREKRARLRLRIS